MLTEKEGSHLLSRILSLMPSGSRRHSSSFSLLSTLYFHIRMELQTMLPIAGMSSTCFPRVNQQVEGYAKSTSATVTVVIERSAPSISGTWGRKHVSRGRWLLLACGVSSGFPRYAGVLDEDPSYHGEYAPSNQASMCISPKSNRHRPRFHEPATPRSCPQSGYELQVSSLMTPGAQALKFRSNVGSSHFYIRDTFGIRLIWIYIIISVFGWAPSSCSISHGYQRSNGKSLTGWTTSLLHYSDQGSPSSMLNFQNSASASSASSRFHTGPPDLTLLSESRRAWTLKSSRSCFLIRFIKAGRSSLSRLGSSGQNHPG